MIDANRGDEVETRIFEGKLVLSNLMFDLKFGARLQHAFGRIAASRRLEITMPNTQQIGLATAGVEPVKIRSIHSHLVIEFANDLDLSYEEKLIGARERYPQRIAKHFRVAGCVGVEFWMMAFLVRSRKTSEVKV
jgi:hypothetical protein